MKPLFLHVERSQMRLGSSRAVSGHAEGKTCLILMECLRTPWEDLGEGVCPDVTQTPIRGKTDG